jgi:hypothetical protein
MKNIIKRFKAIKRLKRLKNIRKIKKQLRHRDPKLGMLYI